MPKSKPTAPPDHPIPPPSREIPLFVSLGSGVRWRHERHLMANLPPMKRGHFRLLCRRLCVPLIQSQNGYYVDHLAFCLVLRFISRIGAPEFLLPGSPRLRALGMEASKAKGFAVDLDLPTFLAHQSQLVSELVAAARISGLSLPDDFTKDTRRAAQRLAAMAALIPFSRRAAQSAVQERIHEPSSLPTLPLIPYDQPPPSSTLDESDPWPDQSQDPEPSDSQVPPKPIP